MDLVHYPDETYGAGQNFSDAHLLHLVRLSGSRTVALATQSQSHAIWGVLKTTGNSGQAVAIGKRGPQRVVAGGAITAGTLITANTSGRATAAASGSSGWVIGRTTEDAAADGDYVRVDLCEPYRLVGGV